MILLLPFMQYKSGHHIVAEALAAHILEQEPVANVETLDIFHYTFPHLEPLASKCYLTWIQRFPSIYSRFYAYQYANEPALFKPFIVFEQLMEQALATFVTKNKPRAIICTHSFPSQIASRLKKKGLITAPIINAYTDFFASNVWAKEGIDLHIVPTLTLYEALLEHTDEQQLVLSNIPVHPRIERVTKSTKSALHIVVAGGNSGLGSFEEIIQQAPHYPHIHISILCGNNEALYKLIEAKHIATVTPYRYIADRNQLNALYDTCDAIITKPGGVAVTEALMKKIPIFSQHVLPGQEQMNMQYLQQHELVFTVHEPCALAQIDATLQNDIAMAKYMRAIEAYHASFQMNTAHIVAHILQHCAPLTQKA